MNANAMKEFEWVHETPIGRRITVTSAGWANDEVCLTVEPSTAYDALPGISARLRPAEVDALITALAEGKVVARWRAQDVSRETEEAQ